MNLIEALKLNLNDAKVVLVGKPVESTILDSNDEPYFVVKLKDPVVARCSTDPAIEPIEVDEVYVRKAAIEEDGWQFVNEENPAEGYFRDKWVVDFSKNHEVVLYQETSIKKYYQGKKSSERDATRKRINEAIRSRMTKG